MKKFILSCIAAILCICAAAAVAYYVGNLPIETYWPNKQVRLSIPRKFFVPNGTAKVYHENGKLAYQYNVINNTKNGEVRFYLPNKTVTMHYLNDTLIGLVNIENEINKKDSDTKDVDDSRHHEEGTEDFYEIYHFFKLFSCSVSQLFS